MHRKFILRSDREQHERAVRNRWLVAGAVVIWLIGFSIGYFWR